MSEGIVKWFNSQRGYGFIERENKNDPDIFVHYMDILMPGFKILIEGDRVKFDVKDTERGLKAVNVVTM